MFILSAFFFALLHSHRLFTPLVSLQRITPFAIFATEPACLRYGESPFGNMMSSGAYGSSCSARITETAYPCEDISLLYNISVCALVLEQFPKMKLCHQCRNLVRVLTNFIKA